MAKRPYPIERTIGILLKEQEDPGCRHIKCSIMAALKELGTWLDTCGASPKVITLAAGLSVNAAYKATRAMNAETLLRFDDLRRRAPRKDQIIALANARRAKDTGADIDGAKARRDGPVAAIEEVAK